MGGRAGGGGAGMGSGARGLSRSLSTHESSIRGNDYETLIVLDEKGNVLVNKKGGAHSVEYGADGIKTTNAIVTHNHPSGGSFSWQDMAGMVYYNQKEMRATGKEFTFSMKRPEKGWGVTPKKAADKFKRALANARRAYKQQKTGNAASDRALWISLTHKYNGNAAKSLGWDYSVKKNK
jgi:hypothetical protein